MEEHTGIQREVAVIDAVAVGLANLDTLGVVDAYPHPDRTLELETFSLQGGGPAATAACALAALGRRVAFVGKVGDDDHGRFVRDGLAAAGVDVHGLVTEAGRVTPFSFIVVERGTRRRTVFWTRGDVSPLSPDEVRPGLLDGAKVLLLDGLHPDAQLVLAKLARSRGVKVTLDASSLSEPVLQLCRCADHVIASERIARELGGSVDRSLRALRELGPGSAVITLGEDGCVGTEGDTDPVYVDGFPAPAVDTTGAGDVFHGAYAYGVMEGWNVRRRLEFANAAAALKCRTLGARAGLPSLGEVQQALRSA